MSGTKVRITAQLIDARTDTHLWSETYDRDLDDVFKTQDEIASEVVERLNRVLDDSARNERSVDGQAYDLLLQARYLDRLRTPESLEQSIKLLQDALAIDASSAQLWEYLGMLYMTQAQYGLRPIEEGFELARESAEHALLLDPDHYAAYSLLARVARDYDRDFEAAARNYQRAIELRPYSGANYGNASYLVALLGQLDLAIEMAKYASAQVPVDPIGHSNLGGYYLYAREYDEAVKSYRKALTLSPQYVGAGFHLGLAYLLQENYAAAQEAIESESLEVFRLLGQAIIADARGDNMTSNTILDELIARFEQDASYNIAYVYAYRGDADLAFEYLEKARVYKDSGLTQAKLIPLFDGLHDDPRWLPFLESIGIAPSQLATIEFRISVPQ